MDPPPERGFQLFEPPTLNWQDEWIHDTRGTRRGSHEKY